jgi:hypothetical protein
MVHTCIIVCSWLWSVHFWLITTSSLGWCFVVFCVIFCLVWIMRLLVLVVESPLSAFIVVQVWEWLIIDPELILVSMLHDVQQVLANSKGELECIFEFWVEKDLLSVLQDLLLSRKHTLEVFNGEVLIVQFESPNVLLLCALEGFSNVTYFKVLRLDRHENILIN